MISLPCDGPSIASLRHVLSFCRSDQKKPKFLPKVPTQRRAVVVKAEVTDGGEGGRGRGRGRGRGDGSRGARGGRGRGGAATASADPDQIAFVGGSGVARAKAPVRVSGASSSSASGGGGGQVLDLKPNYLTQTYSVPEGFPAVEETESALWPPSFDETDHMPPIALHALDAQVPPLLGDFADSEDLLFIQLPPVASLASLKEVPSAVVVKPEATAAGGPAATAGAAVDEDVSMGESESIRSALKGLKQGSVGKLRIHASGRRVLVLGDSVFELDDGAALNHVIQIALVDPVDARIGILGGVSHRLVARLDPSATTVV